MLNLRLLFTLVLLFSIFQTSAQCPPSGDPAIYGQGHWRGYLYGTKTFTDYRGFTTESEQFSWNNPGSLFGLISTIPFDGTNICENHYNDYSVRYRMTKNFNPGFYTFNVGADDGYRFSVDGGVTWIINNWDDHAYQTSQETIYLNGSANLVLEYYQNSGTARLQFSYSLCRAVTAPTAITGATCNTGGGMTLTAVGGSLGTGSVYQWGTGTNPGSNIIPGQNQNTYVNPIGSMTYWVRIYNSTCGEATPAVFTTIVRASTAPTHITGPSTSCPGSNITLQANGGSTGTNGSYQWGTGAVGSNIIAGQTNATITVNPNATTQYWVRRTDSSPCNSSTNGVTFTVNVLSVATAPTSISSSTVLPLCPDMGGTTLSANGGSNGSNSTFQWGTGSVIGNNVLTGQTNPTMYINPTTTTTYWVRRINGSPCNTPTGGVVLTVNVATYSVSPTSISGANSVCSGANTTLTAVGGTVAPGGTYQWGTGYTVGQNIISGAATASITVSPVVNTVYWVRIIDAAPCYRAWVGGPTREISITSTSTAPIWIATTQTSACASSSVTLTANGGTSNAGSSYQWGTGTIPGSNVISGNGATITVNPTSSTTYWVRRFDSGCNSYTGHASTTVSISAPAGNPSQFGTNSWNVYGYVGGDLSLSTATYAGYYTQNTLGFNSQSGTNSWENTASPSSSAGWNGCPVPADNFTTVHKRKGFPCGTYSITMALWDDSSVLYIDGVQQWSCNDWSGNNSCNGFVGNFNLGANSEIEVRTRENTGLAGTILNITNITVTPTAPTALAATNTTICAGSSVTLTASGGINGTSGVFQWGTGSVGANIITNQTSATLTMSPAATTTYWVRRISSHCGTATGARSLTVNVIAATVAGTLSTESTEICKNTAPNDITLSGNVGSVIRWESCNNENFIGSVTNIASTATVLTSAQMGTISATKYYRAVIRNANCSTEYTEPIQITVPSPVTYSGTWNGTPGPTKAVIITNNLDLTADMEVCSCKVTGAATLTITENKTLTVRKEIEVIAPANLVVENNGSLVQIDNNNTNAGSITVKRKTTQMKQYDFSYWSAPVQNFTLFNLSPATLSDKFYSFDPVINNWQIIANGAQQMQSAKGYIVRAPQGWSPTNATNGIYQSTFIGQPNNGIIPVNLIKAASSLNLIGNPYPSAIDIDLFLTDPVNENLVEGTIYLWTHNTPISTATPGPAYANYTANDYAKYNLTGGVKTATAAITGAAVPTGKIASGQAFFIDTNPALPSGTYAARFTNDMRVSANNNQFFRSATSSESISSEKSRLWLSIANTAGSFNEMLLGYVAGATNGMDRKYDGKTFEAGNPLGIYSLLGEEKLSIQGRALPFDATDIIPLGYNSATANTVTIKIEDVDGVFETQQVYLVDKVTNTTHSLNAGNYTFTTAAGTFNNRFELHFTNGLLDVDSHSYTYFQIATTNKTVNVRSIEPMKSITIYDLTGKVLFTDSVNENRYSTPAFDIAAQVLMVKITFENGTNATRKVSLD